MEILIHQNRIKRHMTLEQLAELSGISKSTLNDLENGKRSPRLEQLESIAAALGVSINDLFQSEHQY